MTVPTQLQNRIADDIALLVIDRIRAYARQHVAALNRAAIAATDPEKREALMQEAAEFVRLARTFEVLTNPDGVTL